MWFGLGWRKLLQRGSLLEELSDKNEKIQIEGVSPLMMYIFPQPPESRRT